MSTVYTFVRSPNHVYPDHPERPARLDILERRLKSFDAELVSTEPAAREEIGYVHNPTLIATPPAFDLRLKPSAQDAHSSQRPRHKNFGG